MPHSHARDVFSYERAAHLDTKFRRILYRPDALAERYVTPGSRVLDFGCGPGFFTRAFAKRVGETGSVIAADLQEEMLAIVREKLTAEGLISRVTTHRCKPDSLDLSPEKDGQVDAAFAIFVVHEVPDRKKLFSEIAAMLRPGGTLFYSEPPVLVPKKEFRENLALMETMGLAVAETRWYFLNRAALLKKQ
jgi:ubiquinone/menaquinone biosynthesis C-methylase UbiE